MLEQVTSVPHQNAKYAKVCRDMTGLGYNQPESSDVGMKPKIGLKEKYIHFVKSLMVQEPFESKPPVEKVVEPMNNGNIYGIDYDIPESSNRRRSWSPKRPSSAGSSSKKESHYNYHNCKPVQRRYMSDNRKEKTKVHSVSSAHNTPVRNEKEKMIWNTLTGRPVRVVQVWVSKRLISSGSK